MRLGSTYYKYCHYTAASSFQRGKKFPGVAIGYVDVWLTILFEHFGGK
jgi:hypothetical protein